MKKTILILLAIFAGCVLASAQPRSIGLRSGNNWDISYQHTLNPEYFLTVEVGVPGVTFTKEGANLLLGTHAAVIFDQLDPFGKKINWDKKGEWHWYMGMGVKGGIYGFESPAWHAGLATHIGIEYDFDFPMGLFFDSRSTFGATNYTGKVGFDGIALMDMAFGIRFLF